MKKMILFIIVFLLIFNSLPLNNIVSYASSTEETKVLVAYFQYWKDPVKGWLFDDDADDRHSMTGPNSTVENYTLKMCVPDGYTVKNVEMYDPDEDYENLDKLTSISDDDLMKYTVTNMAIYNRSDLIGESETVTIKLGFMVPPIDTAIHETAPNGMDVYKNYLPIALIVERPEDEITLKYVDEDTGNSISASTTETMSKGYNTYSAKDIDGYTYKYARYDDGEKLSSKDVSVWSDGNGSSRELVFYNGKEENNKKSYLTITGEASPNPVTLKSSSEHSTVTVTSQIHNLINDEVEKWEISANLPGVGWQTKTINSSSDKRVEDFDTEISQDVDVLIKAKAYTKKGQVLEAQGNVFIFTKKDVESTIKAKLRAEVEPTVLQISKSDFENNVKQTVKLTLDGYGSSASEGIESYLYYYRVSKDRGWQYSEWANKDIHTFNNVEIYPDDFKNVDELEIRCRDAVKDKLGNIGYDSDRVTIKYEIITQPPETQLHLPDVFYPIEVINASTYKNIITWDYVSKDKILYKESVVSLYKLVNDEWQPVFENQYQEPKQIEVNGKADERFKMKTQVIDELGKTSEWVEDEFIIINSDPIISLKFDTTDINNNILGINVENLTPIVIESIFPTSYTHWEIIDAQGNILENGAGKAPESIIIDQRYKGMIVTGIQYAENILHNKAKGIDRYINNSWIDFVVDPTKLFETELTTVTDLSEAISNKVWTIKNINDANFEPLNFIEENKFTKSKGHYEVKLTGNGKYGATYYDYQYANDPGELKKEPMEITEQEVKNKQGDNVEYVVKSTEWNSGLEKGSYNIDDTLYKYRRQIVYMGLKTEEVFQVKPVEFVNGKPKAFLEITADAFKVFKKITYDGSKSVDVTDRELQSKYPIQFDSPRTQLILEPLDKLNGNVDYNKNKYIKGIGKSIENGKVIFKGKEIQEARHDLDGAYRASYKVYNGLMDSDWVSEEIVIQPDLSPTIDINVGEVITYREPNDNLKAYLHVTADYSSPDGDQIDFDKSKLFISYDKNKDTKFENDGNDSTQWIKKNTQSLQTYLSVINKDFNNNKAIVSLAVDNVDKNILGKFKFEFEVVEKPTIPNFDIFGDTPVMSANTFGLDDKKKVTLIDNQKPVVILQTGRKNTGEVWIIEETNQTFDINNILNQLKLNRINTVIHYIKQDGTIITKDNF